jgi:CubicO group peptidase (beta-lactamase class C family)
MRRELLTTRVLVPLGMTATYLYQEPAGIDLATPYLHRNAETDYFMVPVGLEGAGRIRSTARDLARFARAVMGLDSTSLDGALQMTEALHFRGPSDGGEVELGLGWGGSHSGGDLFVGHGGGTWGFTPSIDLDRTRQLGTIILTNSRHDRDCLPAYLAYWIDAWQRTVALDPAALAAYRGDFASISGLVHVEVDGGRLSVSVPGHARQRVQPEGGDRFFSLSDDLELRFDRDPKGRISGVSLRTGADPAFAD